MTTTEQPRTVQPCLGCGEPFPSRHPSNGLCGPCRAERRPGFVDREARDARAALSKAA